MKMINNPHTGLPDMVQDTQRLEDHVDIIDGNPHGTDWDMLEGTASWVPLNTSSSGVPTAAGTVYWNSTDGTVSCKLLNDSDLQIGQEMHFYAKASGNIANGELCQFAGVQGNHILAKKVVAAELIANPHYLVGVATQSIANNDFGYITWFGKVNGVYTKTPANNDSVDWLAGDILYFDNSTGQLTKIAPSAPGRRIEVAAVIKEQDGAAETGIILVRPTFSHKLTDLEDVDGTALDTSGQLLVWDQTGGYWDPSSKIYFNEDATNGPELGTDQDGTARDIHLVCGTDKTMVLDSGVWKDVMFPMAPPKTTGAGNPTLVTYNGNMRGYAFAVNDVHDFDPQEMEHDSKVGSTATWHIHFLTLSNDGTDRGFKVEIEYDVEPASGALAAPTTVSVDITIPAGTAVNTVWRENIATFTIPAIARLVGARIKRVASALAAPSVDPVIRALHYHYEIDTIGSRQITTK